MAQMDKAYEPGVHDAKWQKFWDTAKLATPEVSLKRHPLPSGKSYTISMPPPNVTGVLHQGHALMLALEDTLIRHARMRGHKALYLPGTDHASIAVQALVVKHLAAQKIDYRALGREKFVEECWRWIREYQPRIYGQIRTMGTSCDWSRVKFTMDPELNKAVTHAWLELNKKGLVYRAERLVHWSPKGQTGLSDLEVIYQEREGSLWHIQYPLEGGGHVTVATTRPETMLGDTAVAVNPDDERYKKIVGKYVLLPFVNRKIPVIADSFVDAAFGSGVVKITPAHDHNDFECGQRHKLPMLNILTKQGTIVNGLPGEAAAFGGLDRFKARDVIVKALEEKGLLEKVEKHKNRVGVSERWNDVVEPFLSYQWYLKMDGMAQKAVAAVQSGAVEIHPREFHNQFMRWMENIHDWCVSRQLWWGHPIPAWHCARCGHFEITEAKPGKCSKCGSAELTPDSDVFDTWFSSGLWPFSTLGWPDKTSDMKAFYPTQVMETGFDILFFWVARMLMFGLEFTGQAPFSKIWLHPMVRDEHGQKMSKSKGNVVDPLEIVKEHGTDSLRFTLNILCVQGRDLSLSQERIENSRHFINKVWNATRFALMGDTACEWRKRPPAKTLHDRWILTRLDEVARDLSKAWEEFRMQEAAELAYHFVWSDYCDWYLESAKATRDVSQPVVLHVLGEALKLLHPLIPHVSEELYHALPGVKAEESLMVAAFPAGEAFPDAAAKAEWKLVQDFVSALRTLRAESKVPPNKKINIYVPTLGATSKKVIDANQSAITMLAKLEKIHFAAAPAGGPVTKLVVTALEAGSNIEISVPITELKDLGEEKQRLAKELQNLEKLVGAQQGKLGNEGFVSRAPPEVIEKERLKLAELKDKLERTRETLSQLG